MALAGSQNLPGISQRLSSVLNDELPAFLARVKRRTPPIIDTSDGATLPPPEDHDEALHVIGLKKLHYDIEREHIRLQKFMSPAGYEERPSLSTNAPYLLGVFDEMVQARAVIAVCKTFPLPTSKVRHKRAPKAPDAAKAGVKVDVVSDDGRKWTRINTVTADRFLRELYELEGSGEESSCESDEQDAMYPAPFPNSSLATPRDNSLIIMGTHLLQAAQNNPISGRESITPSVCVRLTRLHNPLFSPGRDAASDQARINAQIERLRQLGIEVTFGERHQIHPRNPSGPSLLSSDRRLVPTISVNLDLSILIALSSDISHSTAPTSSQEAMSRFRPLIRQWRKGIKIDTAVLSSQGAKGGNAEGEDIGEHSRSLAMQSMQESQRGLIFDIRERLMNVIDHMAPPSPGSPLPRIQFWTTPSAKERCIAILNKIGGPEEKLRGLGLFANDAGDQFWKGSKYEQGTLPGLPIQIFPADSPPASNQTPLMPVAVSNPFSFLPNSNISHVDTFWSRLQQTCETVLFDDRHYKTLPPRAMDYDETVPYPTPLPTSQSNNDTTRQLKVTTHTAQSLLWGASCGMTTLTANKASVRSILREMVTLFGVIDAVDEGNNSKIQGSSSGQDELENRTAAIWIVEPRSLSEGMRIDRQQ